MGTVGFDIEFFVSSNKTCKIIPICGLLGGNKHQHKQLGDYEVHEDNVALEVNSPVFTDSKTCMEWLVGLRLGITDALLRNTFNFHVAQTRLQHVITFPKEDLEKAGPQALEIGCDPDFSCYEKDFKIRRSMDLGSFNSGNRFVGGHVHLGYSTCKDISPHYIARIMHLISLWSNTSSKGLRTDLYGNGLFRPKPYGLEYRSIGTGSLLTEEGLNFVSACFQLADMLEQSPQEVAELYSQFSEKDWKTIGTNKISDKVFDLIFGLVSENFRRQPITYPSLDGFYIEDYRDSEPGAAKATPQTVITNDYLTKILKGKIKLNRM